MTTSYLPSMVGNSSPLPFKVTASSNVVDAFKAFDSDVSTSWSPASTGSTEYLETDLAVSIQLTTISVRCPLAANSPVSITISGANSAYPAFTSIQTFTGLVFTSGVYLDLILPSVSPSYRYYRITLTNQNGSISVIDSVLMQRVSSTSNSIITLLNYGVRPLNNALIYQLSDINLFRTGISFSNHVPLRFSDQGVIKRPITGQIFPRGFPVEKSTIINAPLAAVNLADYTNGSNGVSVKQIAGINTTPYDSNLNTNCGSAYQATGSFCNQLYANDQDVMWKYNGTAGATWSASNPVTSTGVLVVDLGVNATFNYAHVFQMFDGSGKTTHLELFKHSTVSGTFPVHTDSGWVSIAPESVISAGTTGYNGNRTGDISIISSPSKISLPLTSSRYIKIHCRNTGIYGSGGWIELGGFKLFNV